MPLKSLLAGSLCILRDAAGTHKHNSTDGIIRIVIMLTAQALPQAAVCGSLSKPVSGKQRGQRWCGEWLSFHMQAATEQTCG